VEPSIAKQRELIDISNILYKICGSEVKEIISVVSRRNLDIPFFIEWYNENMQEKID